MRNFFNFVENFEEDEIMGLPKIEAMCIIQCINCSVCLDLMLVPLKNDYFDGDNPRHFQDWLRYNLVHRFRNTGRTHLVVGGIKNRKS